MRKLVFNGWGSEDLLEFLSSIGKDTAVQLSQQQVFNIIIAYCVDHSLFDPEKKKKIHCDAKLNTLFRRKSINKNLLNTHLGKHFSDNQSDDDDDELGLRAEFHQWIEGIDAAAPPAPPCKRMKDSRSEADGQNTEVVVIRKPRFASVTVENIKRVYLRKSVLEELVKEPESFDAKVIGGFVRIKADPNDYRRRINSRVLALVTGVKRSPENAELKDSILLLVRVSGVLEDVPICKVSDDKFTEEECEDLRQQVKDGLIQRPVFANFQEKATSLHEVITRDWIARELLLLKRLSDQANEKGWRRELGEYLERFTKLATPEEQSRLIREIPEIIGDDDELEPEFTQTPKPDVLEASQQPEVASKVAGNGAQATENSPAVPVPTASRYDHNLEKSTRAKSQKGEAGASKVVEYINLDDDEINDNNTGGIEIPRKSRTGNGAQATETTPAVPVPTTKSTQAESQKDEAGASKAVEYIDLDDDDDDEMNGDNEAVDLNAKIWHCATTTGVVLGGLHSMSLLKEWKDTRSGPCLLRFKVWKEGQSKGEAILLDDAIRQFYHLN
ncbi:Uncharacterized protein At5g08430 [Linum grandiflorum]